MLLERVFDDEGEPAGYRQLTGMALLSPDRRAALDKLATDFSFMQAKAALGRADDPTNKFLRASIQAGVVEKIGRGKYKKVTPSQGNAVLQADGVE